MDQATQAVEGVNWLSVLIPYIVIFAVFYFLLIRPQRKRDKETKAMLEALKVGDQIVTIGGIYGKIINIKDDILTIEVGADKTKLKIARWAVKNLDN